MKRLEVKPNGWPVKFFECPPGLFTTDGEDLFLKTAYGGGNVEAYNCAGGGYFTGGVETIEERNNLVVTPLEAVWEED